ncbi:MAG: antitoxin MazE-like protein [Pseudomonadota bacterium]
MVGARGAKVSKNKVQAQRNRLGYVRSAAFRAQAHRQSLAVATSAQAAEDQAFIDAIGDEMAQ